MEEKKYWVGFNLIKGLGAVVMQGLVVHFGDLESAWKAELPELMEAGLGAKLAEDVLTARKQIDLNQVWSRIETLGIKILTWWMKSILPGRKCSTNRHPSFAFVVNI